MSILSTIIAVTDSISKSEETVVHYTTGTFAAVAASFIQESFQHMIPWLIVSLAIIICDLIVGLRKAYRLGEEIRISKAVRRTMGKLVTYFSFVAVFCFVNIAAGNEYPIEKFACLIVCAIEVASILSNWLKMKGYNVDMLKLAGMAAKKVCGADINLKEIIQQTNINNKEEDKQ